MREDEYNKDSKELSFKIPQFGGHEWEWPVFNDFEFAGTAGSGQIAEIRCLKCNYKIRATFRYKTSETEVRLRVSYFYDEDESCNSFKMKQALE